MGLLMLLRSCGSSLLRPLNKRHRCIHRGCEARADYPFVFRPRRKANMELQLYVTSPQLALAPLWLVATRLGRGASTPRLAPIVLGRKDWNSLHLRRNQAGQMRHLSMPSVFLVSLILLAFLHCSEISAQEGSSAESTPNEAKEPSATEAPRPSSTLSGCQVCADTGDCSHAFHGKPGQFCGDWLDRANQRQKCCCPENAVCKVSTYTCNCAYAKDGQGGRNDPSYGYRDGYYDGAGYSFTWLWWLLGFLLPIMCCCACGYCIWHGIARSREDPPVSYPSAYSPAGSNMYVGGPSGIGAQGAPNAPTYTATPVYGTTSGYGSYGGYGGNRGGGMGAGAGAALGGTAGLLGGVLLGEALADAGDRGGYGGGYDGGGEDFGGGGGGGGDFSGDF